MDWREACDTGGNRDPVREQAWAGEEGKGVEMDNYESKVLPAESNICRPARVISNTNFTIGAQVSARV